MACIRLWTRRIRLVRLYAVKSTPRVWRRYSRIRSNAAYSADSAMVLQTLPQACGGLRARATVMTGDAAGPDAGRQSAARVATAPTDRAPRCAGPARSAAPTPEAPLGALC